MAYLLKCAASAETVPIANDSSWSSAEKGALLGGLLTIPGLGYTGKKAINRFKDKLLNDFSYALRTGTSHLSQLETLKKLTGGNKSPFNWDNYLVKGKLLPKLTPFGKGVNGASFALAGFRNLKLPGKLKALGLLAAPFATIPVGAGIGSALD